MHVGDCRDILHTLPSGSARCCVTSPPYWGLRDYGNNAQIGLEREWPAFVEALVGVFREVRRVLADDGTLWLNLGDCYATGAGAAMRPGGGEQGARWLGERSGHAGKHTYRGAMGPATQPNRLRQPGLKPKDLVGMPWRVAFALQADGWTLRSDIIWAKPNPMPESVTDRPTKSHEYVFLLSKSEHYFYDGDAIREPDSGVRAGNGFRGRQGGSERASAMTGGAGTEEPWTPGAGRNARTVWPISPKPFKGAHFATMPPELAERCVLAGSAVGDTVLDPFAGAGTTGLVASRLRRAFVGIELNPQYARLAEDRIAADAPLLAAR